MRPGDFYVDLRDKSVVRIRRVFETNTSDTHLVEVIDVPRAFTFVMDSRFLGPRALLRNEVLEWLERG